MLLRFAEAVFIMNAIWISRVRFKMEITGITADAVL
jgi:hypothetical protein